ncbi:MAG: hypothetical protein ACKVZJ_08395 [Phycisphaerales bacterium]
MVALVTELGSNAVERELVDWKVEVESRLEIAGADAQAEAAGLPAGTRREHVIVQIRLMNPGATREMLDTFTDGALTAYLDHLKLALAPRGPQSRWVRSALEPCVSRYRADAE